MENNSLQEILEPGKLWERTVEQTKHGLQCGALQPIATNYEFVEQNGMRFLVRSLANLERKNEAKKKHKQRKDSSSKDFNPFLPYEPDLFVGDISQTHLCLLNKYNVVDHHLLIITRAFEEQESWLTVADFTAMGKCLAEIDGLAFYNGGTLAGSSQRHKHLQLVPLPLIPDGERIPLETALKDANFTDGISTIPKLPFLHAFAKIDTDTQDTQDTQAVWECYRGLLAAVGLPWQESPENKQIGAYNLLATREWMMIVKRSQECFQSISINSLGFAGTMFVRNQEEMEVLKEHGPMTILSKVGKSRL